MFAMTITPSPLSTSIPALAGGGPPAQPIARSRLLIVDDDEGVRAAISVIFEPAYEVQTVADGRSALEAMQRQAIDVVTLDLDLPGLAGIEVLAQMKQHDPFVEVIILTGQATLESARQAIQLGAFAYLTKPFDTLECRKVIQAALNRRTQLLKWRALEQELQRRQVEQEIERTRSEIYATVIHDLNSPLSTASGLIELLRLDLSAVTPATPMDAGHLDHQLDEVSRQLRFCSSIIHRYLGFMRHAPGEVDTVELGAVLEDLRHLMRVHPAAKNNQLLVQDPDGRLVAAINGVDLLQVLLNLTVNALHASNLSHQVEVYCQDWPGGGAAPDSSKRPEDFFVFGERLGAGRPMVSITVRDNGTGIPAASLPTVFRSFHTTKQPGRGTGLGLSVVRRIVDEGGGAVQVHSVVGKGTAFTVFLPRANHEPAQS